jgi:hypothetical protein
MNLFFKLNDDRELSIHVKHESEVLNSLLKDVKEIRLKIPFSGKASPNFRETKPQAIQTVIFGTEIRF